ncbi:MAG: type II toxin-antitoxin system PemK/MazF family toxin [Alphaproteobacteria bacterium]
MDVARGDLVSVVLAGAKSRPVLVVQADPFAALNTVTVLRLTSEVQDLPFLRVTVDASPDVGLREPAQVMVDKAVTVARDRIARRLGRLDPETMETVDDAFAQFVGLAQR